MQSFSAKLSRAGHNLPRCVQTQKDKDKFKKRQVQSGYKTVALYPEDVMTTHVSLRETWKRCEVDMRAHEKVCKARPVNVDMLLFFEMVLRSTGADNTTIEEEQDEDDNGGLHVNSLLLLCLSLSIYPARETFVSFHAMVGCLPSRPGVSFVYI
jgi:hypothetical protein